MNLEIPNLIQRLFFKHFEYLQTSFKLTFSNVNLKLEI
jgi:hypothetical protein